MSDAQSKDPLHGKTLKAILADLVEHYGWEELSGRIAIKCFEVNPSLTSSLTFLRKTPWARAKVEALYLKMLGHPEPTRPPRERLISDTPASAPPPASPPKPAGPKINVWTGKPFEPED